MLNMKLQVKKVILVQRHKDKMLMVYEKHYKRLVIGLYLEYSAQFNEVELL